MSESKSLYRPDKDGSEGEDPLLGEHCFSGEIEGKPKWMIFGCRRPEVNQTGLCRIALRPYQKNGVGASWAFDGDREAPTIDPSINCEQVCGWHGHIKAGVYVPPR